ncbi:hypothetical protein [Mycobacterium sp. TY814]|uniref:hypothetical protein n=1 Tax=unclassified Mycobacterium TaxID=2642494 RepID=UPI0027416A56|nr:hypothetical protein [Mycobacterium sp. TY814]MDP7721738.1 hypothetical protein [Mycobacterium sp. TY814]
MSAPGQAPEVPDATAGRRRARWTKTRVWVGAVLTSAVVIPLLTLGVTAGVRWINELLHPPQYLAVVVTVPSPVEFDNGWVFATPPAQLPLPPEHGDVDRWASDNGGIPASGNVVELRLQGLHGHHVVIQRITVNVVSRAEPLRGAYVVLMRQKGPTDTYQFGLNLDATPVAVTAETDEKLPHTVSSAAPENLRISAVTTTCTCEWTATLQWSADDGKQGAIDINDNGRAFRVAATTRATPETVGWGPNGWGVITG